MTLVTAQHWVSLARATTDEGRAKVYAMWAASAAGHGARNPFDAVSEPELFEQWAWFVSLKRVPYVVRQEQPRAPVVTTTSAAYAEISGALLEERV